MRRKRATPYVSSGVTWDPEVLEYVDRLAKGDERTRSFIINRIIKDHAKREGIELSTEVELKSATKKSKG